MADWPPLKNSAFIVTFPIYDADGDLVTGAASLDSEVSIDGGTFTDVSPGEAAEIATASGVYTLALAAGEMNGDRIATITKTVTAGAKTAVNVMYTVTRQLVDLAFPVTSGRGLLVEADNVVHADVKEWLGAAPNALQSGRVDSYIGALAALVIDAASIAGDAITAAKVADATIDAATFAAGAIDSSAIAVNAIDADAIADNAIDAGAIATDAIGADELAQAAAIEIADEVLKRDLDQVETTMALHSLGTACLKAVSRIRDNAGTLEIYETDGITLHMSQTVTTDAGADPVDELAAGV